VRFTTGSAIVLMPPTTRARVASHWRISDRAGCSRTLAVLADPALTIDGHHPLQHFDPVGEIHATASSSSSVLVGIKPAQSSPLAAAPPAPRHG